MARKLEDRGQGTGDSFQISDSQISNLNDTPRISRIARIKQEQPVSSFAVVWFECIRAIREIRGRHLKFQMAATRVCENGKPKTDESVIFNESELFSVVVLLPWAKLRKVFVPDVQVIMT